MKLQIEASPKELAALVLELKERRACAQSVVSVEVTPIVEKIIETLNKIAEATGEKYAQVLVEGIDIGTPLASAPKEESDSKEESA